VQRAVSSGWCKSTLQSTLPMLLGVFSAVIYLGHIACAFAYCCGNTTACLCVYYISRSWAGLESRKSRPATDLGFCVSSPVGTPDGPATTLHSSSVSSSLSLSLCDTAGRSPRRGATTPFFPCALSPADSVPAPLLSKLVSSLMSSLLSSPLAAGGAGVAVALLADEVYTAGVKYKAPAGGVAVCHLLESGVCLPRRVLPRITLAVARRHGRRCQVILKGNTPIVVSSFDSAQRRCDRCGSPRATVRRASRFHG
jgi:hypothetical protein